MFRLHNRLGSGGFVVEAALTLIGEPFELITVDSQPSTPLPAAFRQINPWGQVPVLITPDQTIMTETSAILIYLAGRHPLPNVAPPLGAPGYEQFLRWITFMGTNIYEGVLRRIYPERYTTDETGHAGVIEAAINRNRDAFLLLERELVPGPFILGSRMTLADVYLAMLYAWSVDTNDCPGCHALTHRVASHPVIAPIWQRNFDHRLKIKWGRAQ